MQSLTNKQEFVLEFIVENPIDTVSQIADKLNYSPNTIKQDLKGIYRAYGVSGRDAKHQVIRIAKNSQTL